MCTRLQHTQSILVSDVEFWKMTIHIVGIYRVYWRTPVTDVDFWEITIYYVCIVYTSGTLVSDNEFLW